MAAARTDRWIAETWPTSPDGSRPFVITVMSSEAPDAAPGRITIPTDAVSVGAADCP